MIFSMSGHVGKPGNRLAPRDTLQGLARTVGRVWEGAQAQRGDSGRRVGAVVPGDAIMGATMDYDSVKKRVFARTGSVIVMDEDQRAWCALWSGISRF